MDLDRDTIASAMVGTGGAWLLGTALFHGRSGRWTPTQVRGLALSGSGFLMSAVAARWLQGFGNRGIAVALMGTALAMRGMYVLVKARAAIRDVGRDAGRPAAHETEKPRTPE